MTVRKENIYICDVCGHRWLPNDRQHPASTKKLPERCANNACRSRQWNAKGTK